MFFFIELGGRTEVSAFLHYIPCQSDVVSSHLQVYNRFLLVLVKSIEHNSFVEGGQLYLSYTLTTLIVLSFNMRIFERPLEEL